MNQLLETLTISRFLDSPGSEGQTGMNGATNQPEERDTLMSRGFERLLIDVCVFFKLELNPRCLRTMTFIKRTLNNLKVRQQKYHSRDWNADAEAPRVPIRFGSNFVRCQRRTRRKEPSQFPLKPEKKREVNSFIKTTCKWRRSQEAAAPGGTRLPAGAYLHGSSSFPSGGSAQTKAPSAVGKRGANLCL